MSITADSEVYVYVGGEVVLSNTRWATVRTVTYASESCVLAVSAVDNDVPGGILASTSTGVVTDASWKCSAVEETGWHLTSFDDSAWDNAIVIGDQGQHPWPVLTDISAEAKWIWANVTRSVGTTYCRKRLC